MKALLSDQAVSTGLGHKRGRQDHANAHKGEPDNSAVADHQDYGARQHQRNGQDAEDKVVPDLLASACMPSDTTADAGRHPWIEAFPERLLRLRSAFA